MDRKLHIEFSEYTALILHSNMLESTMSSDTSNEEQPILGGAHRRERLIPATNLRDFAHEIATPLMNIRMRIHTYTAIIYRSDESHRFEPVLSISQQINELTNGIRAIGNPAANLHQDFDEDTVMIMTTAIIEEIGALALDGQISILEELRKIQLDDSQNRYKELLQIIADDNSGSFLDGLEDAEMDEPDPTEQRIIISLHLLRSLSIIENIASLALNQKQLQVEKFNLYNLIREAKSQFKDLIEWIDPHKDPPVIFVNGDKTATIEILMNLFNNARKYGKHDLEDTEEKAKVRIEVKTNKDNTLVEISISDKGQGLPDDTLERLFGRNFRLRHHANIEGTGNGLAIITDLVTGMGGTITAGNKPDGSGAIFTFTLPAA